MFAKAGRYLKFFFQKITVGADYSKQCRCCLFSLRSDVDLDLPYHNCNIEQISHTAQP